MLKKFELLKILIFFLVKKSAKDKLNNAVIVKNIKLDKKFKKNWLLKYMLYIFIAINDL